MKILTTILVALFLTSISATAQDLFTGSWAAEVKVPGLPGTTSMKLAVGIPHNNLLYPARIEISYGDFYGDYDMLLVKKNSRQLSIGKHKHPAKESPVSLGNLTVLLNGTLDFTRDKSGKPLLTVNRMPRQNLGIEMPETKKSEAQYIKIFEDLGTILSGGVMRFSKTDTAVWRDIRAEQIFMPRQTGKYFGIQDTMFTDAREGLMRFIGGKKWNTGIVSASVNSRYIFEYIYLTENRPEEDFRLDAGINYIIFHTEEYGKTVPRTGKLEVVASEGWQRLLDYSANENQAATFIILPLYYTPPYQDLDSTQNNIIKSISELAGLKNETIYYHPRDDKKYDAPTIRTGGEIDKSLLRTSTVVGNIKSPTRQVVLALWDDAVEDGDSISLNINGSWVVQGMPVKKRPQFIAVTLDSGTNKIIFIADNEGSIIPNTSMLEIIYGNQRTSYKIDTDLSRNNLVNIEYELKE